jgi:hypothetical protein
VAVKGREQVAAALLQATIHVPPTQVLVGDVQAIELAALVVKHINTCPKCGAEAFVNIDCDLCAVGHELKGMDW